MKVCVHLDYFGIVFGFSFSSSYVIIFVVSTCLVLFYLIVISYSFNHLFSHWLHWSCSSSCSRSADLLALQTFSAVFNVICLSDNTLTESFMIPILSRKWHKSYSFCLEFSGMFERHQIFLLSFAPCFLSNSLFIMPMVNISSAWIILEGSFLSIWDKSKES